MKKNSLPLFTGSSDEQDVGSGAFALAGYDYQVDVSIWLALDLMLGSGLTQTVELEPGTEEDFEAQLACYEPGRVATSVELDDYTLVVQAKLRGGDAWTVNGVTRLLEHGSETRVSAANRLVNPKVRYLLVTSAALNGGARHLAVKRAGTWPDKSKMPASMINSLPKNAAGRIAIIGGLDEDRLVADIKRLLIERFGIPYSRWIDCLKVLRQEAHLRVRRVAGGLWCREELTQIIRSYDGYLASSPELDDYVYPRNWQDLRDAMKARYAAIIIGQSGTGKTLATKKLYEELRRENSGMAHVKIKGGPQELRDDCTNSPVLYDIEDPWGRYCFDSSSRDWNEELSKLFARARADRMIIATSRRDVAMSADVLKSVKPWVIQLEAEHYGKVERQKLYQSRIKSLPRDVQLITAKAEQQVLEKLGTPLEIEKFFDAMRTMGRPQQNRERLFINDAIDKAHEQSIESTVIQQIEQRNDVQAAAIIWGFLKANDAVSIQLLRDIELRLAEHGIASNKGITPTIDFFVAARNLRSEAGRVSYYHPRVEAGLEAVLKRHRVPVNITLRKLLDVLTDPDGSGEDFWGIAARIVVAAANRIPTLDLAPGTLATEKIDAWLEVQVNDSSCKLIDCLRLAAVAGSSKSNTAEFARYLLHRPDKSFGRFHLWGMPGHPNTWYERLSADSAIANIAERFIIEILPDERDSYRVCIVDDLERLAPNLTHAYLKAAAKIVDRGFTNSSNVIAAGALRDISGFESIIDSAVAARTQSHDEQAEASQINLNIVNEVYSDDYADFASENDDGYTAGELIKHYVDKVRRVRGWRQLVVHRHAPTFICYWMQSFRNDANTLPPSDEEVAGAFKSVFDTEEEDTLWLVLINHWNEQYRDKLISRVAEGGPYINVRRTALTCLVVRVPDSLAQITSELLRTTKYERVVELMIDLSDVLAENHASAKKYKAAAITAFNSLVPELRELCDAARNTMNKDLQPLSSAAVTLLAETLSSKPNICALRIRRQLDLSGAVREDIEHVLASSDSKEICIEAIEAAITLEMEDVVRRALGHKFAHVVARALAAMGSKITAPLPAELLSLAKAQGSPIRKALVQLLCENSHIDHLDVLLYLANDTWSLSSNHYGEDDHFPIARAAVDAIQKLDFLTPRILEQLQNIAFDTSDWVVRRNLFEVIIEKGGVIFHQQIFDIAVTPGRVDVKSAAAYAMLNKVTKLASKILESISVDILTSQIPPVAVTLTVIYACRAQLPQRLEIARALSANRDKRVLILLMLWPEVSPCESTKLSLKQLLPTGHPSFEWVNDGPTERVGDEFIADLGAPDICEEILHWLNPRS